MSRLATRIWVSAYLAHLEREGIPAHLVHRGDPGAGAVAVKLAFMNGKASLFTRHYGSLGEAGWHALIGSAPEAEVDAAIARQRGYDPDLWVVEVEDPRGRHLLDRPELRE
jgi:hypothetical protein